MKRSISNAALVILGFLAPLGMGLARAEYGDPDQVAASITELNARAASLTPAEGEATAGQVTLPYLVAVRTDPQADGTHIGDMVPGAVVAVKQTLVVNGVVWYLVEFDGASGVVRWPGNAEPGVLYGVTPTAGWVHGSALTATEVRGAGAAPGAAAATYDVYYLDPATNEWAGYAAYSTGREVDDAVAYLQSQGYQATWVQRQ